MERRIVMALDRLQYSADEARKGLTGDGPHLPALRRDVASAIFLYYEFRTPKTWSFAPCAAVRVDPFTAEVIGTPMHLSELGIASPAEGEVLSHGDTEIDEGKFVTACQLVYELQPEVWSVFLSGDELKPVERSTVRRFARAWRSLIRSDLRQYYQALSADFEQWLTEA